MKTSIRFGLAGTGVGAEFVAKAYEMIEKDGRAQLVTVFGVPSQLASDFASRYGIPSWYDDYDRMIETQDIDAIVISTPHFLHYQMAIKAMQRGIHVLVDKPISIALREADEMIAFAQKRGLKLGVNFQNRFDDSAIRVKRAAENGRMGKLLLGAAQIHWYRDQEYYDKSEWRGKWATEGGGVLINQGIHTIDLLAWIMGPLDEIWGRINTLAHKIEVEDLAVGCLRFRNGALGVIQASTATYPGFPTALEIYGTDGCAKIEGASLKYLMLDRKEEPVQQKESELASWARPEAVPALNHSRVLKDFFSAILEDRKPMIDGVEGRKSLEIITSIYESSKTGESISVA